MSKTIFISYHFNDRSYKGEIVKWIEETGDKTISVDEKDLRPDGPNVVKLNIRDQIKESSGILILVGNDTHNRPWVDYEVAVCKSLQKPIALVRLPNRIGAPPKEVRGLDEISYSKNSIQKFLWEL